MTYFSPSDSGNGSVLAVTWDGGVRLGNLLKLFPKNRPQTILLDPFTPENSETSANPDIHHIAAIPASEAGEAELRRYSLPGLCSLRPASAALTSLFPGLRETGHKTVSLIASRELMAMAADLPKPIRLVIDTPGAELDVLQAIEQAGLLRHVTAIQLRCGIETFFAQSADSREVLSWLEERFFRVSEKNESDTDWPEFLLLRDPLTERIEEPTATLETVSKERDKALAAGEAATKHEAELKDRQNRIDALRDEVLRLRETLITAEERTTRAEMDRDQARKDLGMGLRNAAGLRQDYCDLRDKYALLLNEKNNLEQLILQLTPRLQEAAEHLRHFSDPVTGRAELQGPKKAKSTRQKPVKRSSETVT